MLGFSFFASITYQVEEKMFINKALTGRSFQLGIFSLGLSFVFRLG